MPISHRNQNKREREQKKEHLKNQKVRLRHYFLHKPHRLILRKAVAVILKNCYGRGERLDPERVGEHGGNCSRKDQKNSPEDRAMHEQTLQEKCAHDKRTEQKINMQIDPKDFNER